MTITFPHMGTTYIAAKILFDSLGIDYVIPALNNKKSMMLGSLYSPEEICLPFKLMIGNYLSGMQEGADTILLVGSCGPCRFGAYSELQINILKNLGYNPKFIVIDHIKSIGIREFINRIKQITGKSEKSLLNKTDAIINAFNAISLIDEIEKEAHIKAGYELNNGECKTILNECKNTVLKCDDPKQALNILKKYKKKIHEVSLNSSKNPVKIAIIGEIYTIIEPFSNLFIEDILMDMGISSYRKLTPSWWLKDMLLKKLKLNSRDILKASNEYLPYYIGGHARECIGEAVLSAKNGYDGAIQIYPMGCMPEIVSKSILPTISKDKNFPVMPFVVDEMTGEAGYMTRIEAFIDLLKRRREDVCIGC